MVKRRDKAVNFPQVFENFGWELDVCGDLAAIEKTVKSAEGEEKVVFPFSSSDSLLDLMRKCDEWDKHTWACLQKKLSKQKNRTLQEWLNIAQAVKGELNWLAAALAGEYAVNFGQDDEQAFAEAFACSGPTPDQY